MPDNRYLVNLDNQHQRGSSASSSSSPPSSTGSPRSSREHSLPQSTILDFFDDPELVVGRTAPPLLPPAPPRSFEDESFASSNSDSYDSAGEGAIGVDPRHHLGFNAFSGDEGSYYSSRATSPAPPEAWDGYRPELLSYRSISRNRSRVPSGATTPTNSGDREKQQTSEYFTSHHYQTSALLRKLGGPLASDAPLLQQKKRRPGWWARRAESRKRAQRPLSPEDSNGSTSSSSSSSYGPKSPRNRSCLGTFASALLRQPWVPTQPLTILFTILLFGCFAATLTTFLVHILSTDKARLPFRTYCQTQRPFPHELADSLAPVNVFVGVFSVDVSYERRHLIRTTYARHTKPIDPKTGQPGQNVQLKFILGKPRAAHARRIAMEMESFNDIVVLDITENMNQGKTHAYFKWASENATVPTYYRKQGDDVSLIGPEEKVGVGFKKVDYVVKADDDSLLILSELERHLRVSPREKTYWGYLIRNLFMGGEAYALSADLVQYVATYAPLLPFLNGAEDKRVAKWMRLHPNANQINWITERCYIYDHPKAGTTYAHGFLFPDAVEQIRLEGKQGLAEAERERRGGDLAQSYSTVSKWKSQYKAPVESMTVEEEIEALIEGGGRWESENWRVNNGKSPEAIRWETMIFEKDDARLIDTRLGMELGKKPDSDATGVVPGIPDRSEPSPNARKVMFGKDLYRDPSDLDAVRLVRRQGELLEESTVYNAVQAPGAEVLSSATSSTLSPLPESSLLEERTSIDSSASSKSLPPYSNPEEGISTSATDTSSSDHTAPTPSTPDEIPENTPTGQVRFPPQHYVLPPSPHDRFLPPATLRYDPTTLSLRERRMLGLPHGGTVAVHYLKRHEWFLEAALALIGREKMWDSGREAPLPPPSSSSSSSTKAEYSQGEQEGNLEVSRLPTWQGYGEVRAVDPYWGVARMYGSPLIREDGFISEGREVEAVREVVSSNSYSMFGRLKSTPKLAFALEGGEQARVGGEEERVVIL